VYFPTHHRAKVNGYVDRHIIEAESLIGRPLKPEEVVHHMDEDKSNYNKENLMVFVDGANHARFHKTGIMESTEEPYVVFSPKQYVDRCVMCGIPIRNTKSNKCRKCLAFSSRKVNRPQKQELISLLKTNGFCAVGRMFGVSDNAVRKWCKYYNIM